MSGMTARTERLKRIRHCLLILDREALLRAERRQGRYRSALWGDAIDLEAAVQWLLAEANWYEANRAAVVGSPVLAMKSRHVADELERLGRWLGMPEAG